MREYFTDEEFECPCCGVSTIDSDFRKLLNTARHEAQVPFRISPGGGFRCEDYNSMIGGAHNSEHLRGLAADIRTGSSSERFRILQALFRVGFKRVGVYDRHVHAGDGDAHSGHPTEVVWTGISK